jgi:SAM-dependent methyltransferase
MRIFDTLRAFQDTAALKAAIELGVFTAISQSAGTASEIAAKCGASERGMRILCDVLTANEFLEKRDGRYENTVETGLFLDKNSPGYLGTAAEFISDPQMAGYGLAETANCVRKGGTVMEAGGSVSPENPVWVTFARAMGPLMGLAARFMAQQLPASGPLKVLDIAAGHGMFGISVAQRNPDARIHALDWEAVLEVAKENAEKAGVSSRYQTIPGSAFTTDFGSEYDAVLVPNFLHHFDVPACEGFLRKVHAALKPGGRAVTLEFVPDPDRVKPVIPAKFAMTMLMATDKGDAYTFAELDSMLRKAGFASNVCNLLETQQSVIISTK